MLNVNELEQRWLRYKIKSYIPHIVISISLLCIFFIMLILLNTEEMKPQKNDALVKNRPKTEIKTTQIKVEEKIAIPIVKKTIEPTLSVTTKRATVTNLDTGIKTTSNLNAKMTINPSLDFMKKMQGNTLSNYENYKSPSSKTQFKTNPTPKPSKEQKKRTIVEKKPEIVKEKREEKKSAISIKRQNTHDDISQVVSRFNKNNNPALSLFIAKKYYELGDYHKSYNYALITNEINSNIEASWIVFAKSLVKLQEKEQAIKTLKKYINQSNSNRANILLDDIISGKFR